MFDRLLFRYLETFFLTNMTPTDQLATTKIKYNKENISRAYLFGKNGHLTQDALKQIRRYFVPTGHKLGNYIQNADCTNPRLRAANEQMKLHCAGLSTLSAKPGYSGLSRKYEIVTRFLRRRASSCW